MTSDETADVSVSTTVKAPPDRVYDLISDVTRMGEWSPENVRGRWLGDADGPAVGARFKGKNQRGIRRWSTKCEVVEADPGKAFAFRVSSVAGLPVALWRYLIDGQGDGATVTEEWTDQRGALIRGMGRVATGVGDRPTMNRKNMETTLAALKAAAESK